MEGKQSAKMKNFSVAFVFLFTVVIGDLSRYEEYDYDYDQSLDYPDSNEIQTSSNNQVGRSDEKSFNPKGEIDFTGNHGLDLV